MTAKRPSGAKKAASDSVEREFIESQQRQVLRVRKYSDVNVYGNESSPHERRKINGEEVVIVDDEAQVEDEWSDNPHTLSCGFFLMIWIAYAAFHHSTDDDKSSTSAMADDLKRGITYSCIFFLVYCMLQLPDGHFVRPHPIFWRLMTAIFILYEMILIVILFLRTSDARAFMTHFDSSLGKELPETSYADDCRLYTPENPESHFINLKNTFFDRFVVMHFLGWFVGALMVRSYIICWALSILFEFYEMTFRHWLANFNECWWDHLIFDVLTCNAFGIYFGMKVCRWLEMKKYNWVGIKKIPNLKGKAQRAIAQFTPAYWLAYDWKIFRSADRFWRVMSMVVLLSVMMLNSFFLKTVLWVPASSSLNVMRLAIWYTAGSYAVAEYYIFSTFSIYNSEHGHVPVKKLGPRAWLGVAVVITEVCVVVKHGQGMFTAPFPPLVKLAWGIALSVLLIGSIVYFSCLKEEAEEEEIEVVEVAEEAEVGEVKETKKSQ